MLKTKIINNVLNNKTISIDKRGTFYDLDILRVCQYSLLKEKLKFSTIQNTTELKINAIVQLKKELNLKRKMYIEELKKSFSQIHNIFILDLPQPEKTFNSCFVYSILDKYKIEHREIIGLRILQKFYIDNKNIFQKLENVESDINKCIELINDFRLWFNSFADLNPYNYGNQKALNDYDIDMLKIGKITNNIKKVMYYYFVKVRKTKIQNIKVNKLFDYNQLSSFTFTTENDINKLIEQNKKDNFKISLDKLNNSMFTLQQNIINKYC